MCIYVWEYMRFLDQKILFRKRQPYNTYENTLYKSVTIC